MRTRVITLVILTAVLVAPAAAGVRLAPRAWAAASSSSSGCGTSGYPAGWNIWCQSGNNSPGQNGRAGTVSDPGGVVNTPCVLYPIPGDTTHMLRVCPLPNRNGGLRYAVNRPGATSAVVPVGGAGGGPPVTPLQLLAWARSELSLPLPDVRTAPPRGLDGLVGLPEWFWVMPAQWHAVSAGVHMGGVWTRVTARPATLLVQPGTGPAGTTSECNGKPRLGGCPCPGPGTAYNPHISAGAQRSDCTITYGDPSDGLTGNVYQVSVIVTWDATWRGSGGAGGALAPLDRTTTFALPVTEGQSLNPGR